MSRKSALGRTVLLGSLRAGFAAANAISPALAAAGAERLFLSTRRHPVPARERAWLQGARRAELASEWGSLAVWVWDSGVDEGAPTVALLHGWEGRASQLGAFAPPLVAAGYRVVGVDAPGHGESPGRSSSLVAIAGALRTLGERCGPFAGVVAHSAGAASAVHALRRGLLAGRLVAVAPGVDLEGYTLGFARLFGLSAAASRGLRRRIERRVGVSFDELDPRRTAADMRVPLLVVHDRADREAPFAGGEALARAWPGARFLATEGLGHTRILWDGTVVASAMDFLREGTRAREEDGALAAVPGRAQARPSQFRISKR